MTTVLFVCTGNAARSVMAAAMLRQARDGATDSAVSKQVTVTSAGTHSIPGLPMSTRTRTALQDFDVSDREHRSAQLEQPMVDQATLIAIFEPMHLSYMRKKHPESAHKVASLPRLARDLAGGPILTLAERLQALELADHTFEPWEEVIDPAGGDLPVFQASAAEIDAYIQAFWSNVQGESHAST